MGPDKIYAPFMEELPHELLRAFSADPSSAYAADWRDFVAMIWAPVVTKLAAILDAHQSAMELHITIRVTVRSELPGQGRLFHRVDS